MLIAIHTEHLLGYAVDLGSTSRGSYSSFKLNDISIHPTFQTRSHTILIEPHSPVFLFSHYTSKLPLPTLPCIPLMFTQTDCLTHLFLEHVVESLAFFSAPRRQLPMVQSYIYRFSSACIAVWTWTLKIYRIYALPVYDQQNKSRTGVCPRPTVAPQPVHRIEYHTRIVSIHSYCGQ